MSDNPMPTGPVRVYNSENLDTSGKIISFMQSYSFNPTKGVATLNCEIIANVASSAVACYAVGVEIDHIDVKVGGDLLYTVDGRGKQISTTLGKYEANPLGASEGQLGTMNRAFFGATPLNEIVTLSSLSGTNTNVSVNFNLLIFKPNVARENKTVKLDVYYSTPLNWVTTAGAPVITITMQSVIIEAQYADRMPEFNYLNNEKTAVGASLVDSTDGMGLDQKPGKIIGGIFSLVQSSNFENYLLRFKLVDTNGTAFTDTSHRNAQHEEENRSSPHCVKSDATTGGWLLYPHSVGVWFVKVDEVECNGKLKWAISTHASTSAAIVRVLTILKVGVGPAAGAAPQKGSVEVGAGAGGVQNKPY